MLDVLNDSAAQRANDKMLRQGSTRRRAADVSCTDDDAAAAAAGVAASASTLPASTTSYGGGDSGGGATAAAAFNVFLSHKRSDAKDYARALYNLLVLRGIATFLDFEFREELNDLEKIVAGCTNFIFILTDNVFDSKWCMRELESAVEAGVNIILVCKEGSRWRDEKGVKCCDFPPPHIIDALPGKVRSVFTRKALQHSDEYYQMFVELLLQRIADGDARRAAREAGGAAAAVGGTAGRGSWSTISSGAAPAAVVAATAASRGGSLSQQLLAASPQPQQSPRSSMTSVPPDATTATPSAAAGGVGSSIPYSIPSVTPFAAYHASPSPSALAGRASATAARQFAHTVQGAAFDAAAILELSHDVGALQSKIAQLAADGSVSPRASHYAAQQLVVGTVPAEIARLQADMAHLQQAVRGMEIDLAGLRSMVSQGFASLQTSLHGVLSAMTLNAAAAAAAAAAAQSQQSAPLASQAPTTAAASPAASSAAGARQEA